MDLLGLHRGLKLPAGVAGIERRDLSELMMDTRRCRVGHEEVGLAGHSVVGVLDVRPTVERGLVARLAAALVLLAACGPRPAPPVASQVDTVERSFTIRASRSAVRPLQPLAAPVSQPSAPARPAPQRTPRPPPGASRPLARATNPAAGCTGRMSRTAAHACWDGLLARYPWPTASAFRVLYCESTGDPNAVNGRYHGLMQVDGASFDPAANVAAAYDYWRRRGWEPWECR